MAHHHSPRIVTDSLVLAVDAGNTKSYPGSGTTLGDLSGNSYDMTVNGSPTYTGTVPGYFSFNASQTTKYINRSSFPMPTGNITIEMWVKFATTSVNGGLLSYATSGNDNNALLFFNAGTLEFYGPTNASSLSWAIPNTTNWYQIVRVRNSSTGADVLYVNGTYINGITQDAGSGFTSGGSLVLAQEQDSVGGGFDSGQCFVGDISSLKIYSRNLTADEIFQNYNALKNRHGY